MATGTFTAFPITWNDDLAAFGILGTAGGTLTGPLVGTKFYAGTAPSFSTEFVANPTWSNEHGRYAYVDDSTASFTTAPATIWGHASFNSNFKFSGNQAIDHHHGFQSYWHYSGTGTVTRAAGYHSIGDHTGAGTITESLGLLVQDATGSGPITRQVGVKIEALTRGSTNWAIYSDTVVPSLHRGPMHFGAEGLAATVGYNNNGALDIIPRSGYPVDVKGPTRVLSDDGLRLLNTALTVGGGVKPRADGIELSSDGAAVFLKTSGTDRVSVAANGATALLFPVKFPPATLGALPNAATFSGHCIEVTDATGGPKVCRSNGTVWQILNTSTTVS
jgi:hypothetical protein